MAPGRRIHGVHVLTYRRDRVQLCGNIPRAGLLSTRNNTTTRTTNSRGVGRGHSGYGPGNFSGAWAIHWPGQLLPTFELKCF